MKLRLLLLGLLGFALGYAVVPRPLVPASSSAIKTNSLLGGTQPNPGKHSTFESRLAHYQSLSEATTSSAFERLITGDASLDNQLKQLWSARNPAGFLSYVLEKETGWKQPWIYGTISNWAAKDPVAAETAATTIKDPTYRGAATNALVWSVMRNNPQAGAALMEKHLAWLSPNENILHDPSGAIAPKTLGAVLAKLKDTPFTRKMAASLCQQWVTVDPESAMDWAKSLTDAKVRAEACRSGFSAFAMAVPEKAESFLTDMRALDPDWRPWAASLAPLVETRFRSDPMAALAWAGDYLATSERTELVATLFQKLTVDDLTLAQDLVERLPNQLLSGAVSEVARALAQDSPEDAYTWAAESKASDDTRNNAMKAAAKEWVKKDFDSARESAAKAAGIGETNMLAMELVEALDQWENPAEAITWARDLAPEHVKSTVVHGLRNWGKASTEDAAHFAATFPNGDLRATALYQTGADFFRANPDEALAWFQSLPSEADQRAARQAINAAIWDEAHRQKLLDALK